MPILVSNTIATTLVKVLIKVKRHYCNLDEYYDTTTVNEILDFMGDIKVVRNTSKYDLEPLRTYFSYIQHAIIVFTDHQYEDISVSTRGLNTLRRILH